MKFEELELSEKVCMSEISKVSKAAQNDYGVGVDFLTGHTKNGISHSIKLPTFNLIQ